MLNLFIDTETTGIPKFSESPIHPEQPYIVQLAAILMTDNQQEVGNLNVILNNPGCMISPEMVAIHGITTEMAQKCGVIPRYALNALVEFSKMAHTIIAHNIRFDLFMTDIALSKAGARGAIGCVPYCTMQEASKIGGMPLNHAGKKKNPKLSEAYEFAFKEKFENAHNAMADCRAMMRLYWWLKQQKSE